ncbi:APO9/CPO9 [Stereum hirsutum FP-91666 SS1]|uniref:APO9/CPO9 n=1 Tax=Stereum hirsutum (strain FP-91666) TaxID=721885 RepID=UPI000440E398|nr:APO9/CPO9 [Stereum hirsutum FP-91666 SS1]EIM92463.1 APO9/CPO9 [Stereum hirsutum FP-91666 SS1]
MRLSAAIAIASLLPTVTRTYAFSWLSPDFNESQLKRGLDAIQGDTELVKQIRELYARQQEEVHAWNKAGKPDIAREVLNYRKRSIQKRQNNGTIDAIFGPDDGILVGVANTLVDILEGSKYFPEDNHPFEWPSSTDQRGPCPGMNTLANHGYLPRNGIVTAGEVISASAEVFNMGADLAAVLVGGAVALNGDITTLTFSLGGADARTNSLGKLGGLLGTETGLDGHGRVNEGDASATRCDFYLCEGDNHNMQPEFFSQMLDHAKENNNQFDVNAMANSLDTNPNFYFVPPSALIVMGATYFHPGFFSNGTIGAGGSANLASIASFAGARFAEDGSITYVPERIPEIGWYRRSVPMLLSEALAGILSIYLNPEPVLFGANSGSVNNFIPGPGLLPTNASNVQGLGCFLYNALYADFFGEFDNILFGLESTVNAVLGLLDPALSDFVGCTPNYPDETSPNAYGGAVIYLNKTSSAPGAPQKQPCLTQSGGGTQCDTRTNSYGKSKSDDVQNRWKFTSYVSDGQDPLPSSN